MPTRQKLITIAIACLVFSGADNSMAKQFENSFDLRIESLYLNYNASDEIKQHGRMYGLSISDAVLYRNFMFKVEGGLDVGSLDYSSTDSERLNFADSIRAEARALFGYRFPASETSFITSYIGFGYRGLESDLDEKFASVGDMMYVRKFEYHYIPIGINFSNNLNKGWFIAVKGEYDWFLEGSGRYKLMNSSSGGTLYKTHLDQKSGYGLRGSVELQKKVNRVLSFAVEPFVRYWKIAESESADVYYYRGIKVGEPREPENHTTETGINLILRVQLPPSD